MKKKILIPILTTISMTPILLTNIGCSTENGKSTIVFSSNDGKFADDKTINIINNIPNGTKLSDVAGYITPQLDDADYMFDGWVDEEGRYIPEDQPIKENMILSARYCEKVNEPSDFFNDNLPTIVNVCCQGVAKFAQTYCGFEGSDEDGATTAIKMWMYDNFNDEYFVKPVTLTINTYNVETKIRLIDVGHDRSVNGSKPYFTFDFMDIIDMCEYSNDKTSNLYYEKLADGSERQAFIRQYLNENIFNSLPVYLRKAIKTVDKKSMVVTEDFDENVLDMSYIHSSEKLFPLDMFENGTWVLPFNSSNVQDETSPYLYYLWLMQTSLDIEEHATRLVKNFAGTDYPIDWWLRMGGINLKDSDGSIYKYFGSYSMFIKYNAYTQTPLAAPCKSASQDVATGISPAFCI